MVLLAALALSGLLRVPPPVSRLVTGARRLVACAAPPNEPPRLLLTSSGLETPELQASFRRMLRRACAPDKPPRIAMLVTAQMAPSGTPSKRSPGELRRRRWQSAVRNARQIESALGVEVECVDCARDGEDVDTPLSTAECIWVTGGNTFFLHHHMRRRGVHELVRRRVLEAGCVYVGQSAGSIVAGATIRTAYWKGLDDPTAGGALDGVEWTEDALRGAGLVPDRAFFPHYEAEEHEALVHARQAECGRAVEVVKLTDDGTQAYVVGDAGEEQ